MDDRSEGPAPPSKPLLAPPPVPLPASSTFNSFIATEGLIPVGAVGLGAWSLFAFLLFLLLRWKAREGTDEGEGSKVTIGGSQQRMEAVYRVALPETPIESENETFEQWWYRARYRIEVLGHALAAMVALATTQLANDNCTERVAEWMMILKVAHTISRFSRYSSLIIIGGEGIMLNTIIRLCTTFAAPVLFAKSLLNNDQLICAERDESGFKELWWSLTLFVCTFTIMVGFTQGLRNTHKSQ